MSDRYRQIQHLESQHAVLALCQLLTVSRSGYYDWRRRTPSLRHEGPIAPNRLPEHTPKLTGPNQIWAVDMTYLETTAGWLYLAIVLDLYSRRIVGWAFDSKMPAALPQAALEMALRHRRPPRGLLHHSDRGCQYASSTYRALLRTHGLQASMSRTANPYDNAAVESFFSTLKTECCRQHPLTTPAATKAFIFDYIETFYNRSRLHSALGFLSPVDFESFSS